MIYEKLNNIVENKTGIFRGRLELYLKSWVLPKLDEVLEVLIHWILSRKISSFGKAMTGTNYPINRLNERIITALRHKK